MRTGSVGEAPELPFNGTMSISRHCSYQGAKQAQPRAGSQAWRVFLALKGRPMTYHELTTATDLPLATVCARIGWLKQNGLVKAVGVKPGPFETPNTMWGEV